MEKENSPTPEEVKALQALLDSKERQGNELTEKISVDLSKEIFSPEETKYHET